MRERVENTPTAGRRVTSRAEYVAIRDAAKEMAKKERWMDAYLHFTVCVSDRAHASIEEDDLVTSLLNRSLMALKMDDYEGARADATGALEALRALDAYSHLEDGKRRDARRG